jgi:Ca-activated chloride channel family protein
MKQRILLSVLLLFGCTGRVVQQPLPPQTPQVEVVREEREHAMAPVSGKRDLNRMALGQTDDQESWRYNQNFNTENYSRIADNPYFDPKTAPLSTFSIDVDTASYSNLRRFITQGQKPPADSVRIEEMINYFGYNYPQPSDRPFSVTLERGPAPWNQDHELVLIGLQAKSITKEETPPRNLVFLIDVSGSMNTSNKLPFVQRSLSMLADQLNPRDHVAIVVYAGAAGLVLEPTSNPIAVKEALNRLSAGGSTNGGEGIELAYATAKKHFRKDGINRVILASDGDFNVGVTSEGGLERLIEDKRKEGIFLTVLGFGMGNYKDSTMERLADKGNGNYAYIDSLLEARKVLVEQAGGTLVTVASDVKIQVEFNPAEVAAYRLIGYENRVMRAEDFNDDKKDAGEIGAGHNVTALYEIVRTGKKVDVPGIDPLRYQKPAEVAQASGELFHVKLRYKKPGEDQSQLISYVMRTDESRMTDNLRWASSVAAFGLALRDSPHKGSATYDMAFKLGQAVLGEDRGGYRAEMLRLIRARESMR